MFLKLISQRKLERERDTEIQQLEGMRAHGMQIGNFQEFFFFQHVKFIHHTDEGK